MAKWFAKAALPCTQYLTPSFSSGYYRAAITLGIVALVLVATGAVCASARRLMTRVAVRALARRGRFQTRVRAQTVDRQ
jgi:hypothetical protein